MATEYVTVSPVPMATNWWFDVPFAEVTTKPLCTAGLTATHFVMSE